MGSKFISLNNSVIFFLKDYFFVTFNFLVSKSDGRFLGKVQIEDANAT